MHAVVLKSLGYNVCILEARSQQGMQERAAGLSLWPNGLEVVKTYVSVTDISSIGTPNSGMMIMNGSGELITERPVPNDVMTSSWAVIKGVLETECGKQPDGHGNVRFENNARVTGVAEQNKEITVTYKDQTGAKKEMNADIIIAADGARSFVRNQVLPGIEPEYAGYLAWRGQIPEAEVPKELQGLLTGKLASFRLDGSFIIG